MSYVLTMDKCTCSCGYECWAFFGTQEAYEGFQCRECGSLFHKKVEPVPVVEGEDISLQGAAE